MPHAPTTEHFLPPSLPAGRSTVGTPVALAVWGGGPGRTGGLGFKVVPGGSQDGG